MRRTLARAALRSRSSAEAEPSAGEAASQAPWQTPRNRRLRLRACWRRPRRSGAPTTAPLRGVLLSPSAARWVASWAASATAAILWCVALWRVPVAPARLGAPRGASRTRFAAAFAAGSISKGAAVAASSAAPAAGAAALAAPQQSVCWFCGGLHAQLTRRAPADPCRGHPRTRTWLPRPATVRPNSPRCLRWDERGASHVWGQGPHVALLSAPRASALLPLLLQHPCCSASLRTARCVPSLCCSSAGTA